MKLGERGKGKGEREGGVADVAQFFYGDFA